MTDLWKDIRELDRRSWFIIVAVGAGNVLLIFTGMNGSPTISLICLGILSFMWVVLLQFTRSIMHSSLGLAQESTAEWQAEADFSRELLDDYLLTIRDLKRYDLQSSGIHLERMRRILIKHRPELEDQISEVEHPVGITGMII